MDMEGLFGLPGQGVTLWVNHTAGAVISGFGLAVLWRALASLAG